MIAKIWPLIRCGVFVITDQPRPGEITPAARTPHGSLACPDATGIDSLAAHVREWGIRGSEGLLNPSIAYTPAVGK
jgi:hypothetical protein